MRGHFLRAAAGNQAPAFSAATLAWLAAVEAEDGEPLETSVYNAMGTFADYRIPLGGACCLMAGARTLAGALVPMVGTPGPTAVGFDSGDYNRSRLLQSGSKYLNSNYSNTADAQNSQHIFAYTRGGNYGASGVIAGVQAGNSSQLAANFARSRNATLDVFPVPAVSGFVGMSRGAADAFRAMVSSETVIPRTSAAGTAISHYVYCRNNNGTPETFNASPLAIYSFGPDIDLAAMRTACITLDSALAAAGI